LEAVTQRVVLEAQPTELPTERLELGQSGTEGEIGANAVSLEGVPATPEESDTE